MISRVLEPIPASKAAFRAGGLVDICPPTGEGKSPSSEEEWGVDMGTIVPMFLRPFLVAIWAFDGKFPFAPPFNV